MANLIIEMSRPLGAEPGRNCGCTAQERPATCPGTVAAVVARRRHPQPRAGSPVTILRAMQTPAPAVPRRRRSRCCHRGRPPPCADHNLFSSDPQLKKDGIEYGSAVGAGAVTGAILGGPGGALAGTIIGAGVITAHLIVSHPQATLDSGTVLEFTLNQPLNLVPAAQTGN